MAEDGVGHLSSQVGRSLNACKPVPSNRYVTICVTSTSSNPLFSAPDFLEH